VGLRPAHLVPQEHVVGDGEVSVDIEREVSLNTVGSSVITLVLSVMGRASWRYTV